MAIVHGSSKRCPEAASPSPQACRPCSSWLTPPCWCLHMLVVPPPTRVQPYGRWSGKSGPGHAPKSPLLGFPADPQSDCPASAGRLMGGQLSGVMKPLPH
ncbi:TPA: hypothetical protein N0F65_008231 [Lagenidium giganteum]|uniref:Uncharacterized protein n=1 Tax=Lagenidium giganteum TaxID=4803 RepID=A0AAV2YZG7_9STRA|nr:TPA: hypothetical protein N0F65_008231 [Lagenidium giganteum]